jgi:integrase
MSRRNSTTPSVNGKPANATSDTTPDTSATPAGKPAKPRADFPLFAHATKRWAKKIRGKMHYFGPWSDPDGALARYLEQKDDLHAGRTPRPDADAVTVKDVANAFLNAKDDQLAAGRLSARTRAQYGETCIILVKHLGKSRLVSDLRPDDFAALHRSLAKQWSPGTVGNFVGRVRCVFKHAVDNDLIDRPVRYGTAFRKPSKRTLRLEKAKAGRKLFTIDEVHRVLDAASRQLRAMTLLALNAGLGNADCGRLPRLALDLENGWLDYARGKTGVERRCPLWPETIEAIKVALAVRREPKDAAKDGDLVFITRTGQSWHVDTTESPISYEFGKLLRKLGINGRKRLGFYTLRHTFRTVADETKDQAACDFIMGHADNSMAGVYRERISDHRLRAVVEHIRDWLWPYTAHIRAGAQHRTIA